MIEQDFNIAFVAELASREKQIQQNYRPIIAVHKWFARRPGTLFRSLLLAEFAHGRLEDAFYRSNNLAGLHIADPFMGGGIPLIEANRLGCSITGYDINPMAYWVVREEIEHLDIEGYQKAAIAIRADLEKEVGPFYRTTCVHCGYREASVKYFLWVKVYPCHGCGSSLDLFPGYLIAEARRHPENVILCAFCGELNETDNLQRPGSCSSCRKPLQVSGLVRRGRYSCPTCSETGTVPNAAQGPPQHRLFAIEYACTACRNEHIGRYFKKPDAEDLDRYAQAEIRLRRLRTRFIPDDEIPRGDETDRLHRWGYGRYREMFNARQLLGLELGARLIARQPDERAKKALATNFSDLLRYQNMLCRYDTMALKSLDIFSVHGFPVGLIQCESNMLGIVDPKRATSIGSGGWSNIIDKFTKAKTYCSHPFEVRHDGHRKQVIPTDGEWIGEVRNGSIRSEKRLVNLHCGDATAVALPPKSLDAVLTDPPYFGNVQYAELMDFCYVWLRILVQDSTSCFVLPSTRNAGELTGNVNMGRDLHHFTLGLSGVFTNMAEALKPGAPLAFTYHHNTLEAYHAIAVAMLNARLVCSASLPCPAEMGASIHISGTGSSIIDTVFVCRSTGRVSRRLICDTAEDIVRLIKEDVKALSGTRKSTAGDIRCILYGHLTRLAVWHLRSSWDISVPVAGGLAAVARRIAAFGDPAAMEQQLSTALHDCPEPADLFSQVSETAENYSEGDDFVSF
jgi:adenine-specific DNA methylase